MPGSAWESPIVVCAPCKTEGCGYRALLDSGYCCERCRRGGEDRCAESVPGAPRPEGVAHADSGADGEETTAPCCNGGAKRLAGKKDSGPGVDDGHEAGCARLGADVLRECWWETFRCDLAFEEEAACFVAPPGSAEARRQPAPVILLLTGNGHVDGRQDFFWGGVDVLMQNPLLRERCFIVAPKPTTTCGLLRYNDSWRHAWAEDAVWALFTEVLRRLGPARADPGRLVVTGLSLGAAGVWHLALHYGEHLAAAVPISGHCEWPGDSWPAREGLAEDALRRLSHLELRAYQIDVDRRAGTPIRDMEWLCYELEEHSRDLTLPGMDPGKTCSVQAREWCWKDTGAKWELWVAKGPLEDWSAWDDWNGDNHCLWHRVYPFPEWGLPEVFFRQPLPEERRWRFDSPPLVVDTTDIRRAEEEAWSSHQAKKPRQSPLEGEPGPAAGAAACPAADQAEGTCGAAESA